MKRCFLHLFCVCNCLFFCSPILSYSTEIELIYAAKIPEIQPRKKDKGGLAELATLVKETRYKSPHTMFLHGGDSLAPSVMSSFDQGSHMIDVLNSLEPDAMSISEREFAYKEDGLIVRIAEAEFPFISSNSIDTLTGLPLEGVEEYQCFSYGDHKICAISILDPEVTTHYLVNRIHVQDSKSRILEMSKILREKQADIIILLTAHKIPQINALLENNTLDIVLHADSDEDSVKSVGNGLYVKEGTNEGMAAKLSLIVTGHKDSLKKSLSGQILPLNSFIKDENVQRKIDYYNNKLEQIMDVIIGTTLTPMCTSKQKVRTEENAFGNMAADALRDYYKADIAFINGGSIRSKVQYNAGENITRKDIQSQMPFQNKSDLILIKGSELYSAMENSVSKVENAKGRFLQISGMKMVYCPENIPGERVSSITIAGQNIDLNKSYLLATDMYLTSGGDDYDMLLHQKTISSKNNPKMIWEIVRLYIEKHQTVSPKVEGRIIRQCNK